MMVTKEQVEELANLYEENVVRPQDGVYGLDGEPIGDTDEEKILAKGEWMGYECGMRDVMDTLGIEWRLWAREPWASQITISEDWWMKKIG